ncbi:unnamed protein product [Arctia plantaginis]|uniref:Uncharacterized protein n=1 Tax=Arctia plantaginis TaxID=874455 RepID=A0A8S0YUT4_ARCPL|nr:unnamed protein product [Arctia plantaginis]
MPYPRPCQCGLPAMPANPPCASPVPVYAAPYEMAAPLPRMALPPASPKMAIAAAPFEVPLPKMAIPAAYELSVQPAFPNMAVMPAPYELALPLPLPNPSCGCLETALEKPIPEFALPGFPLHNPFLPAASPVSAMAPFNPLLPPATPCSKCQYLKKIPIPPPCI